MDPITEARRSRLLSIRPITLGPQPSACAKIKADHAISSDSRGHIPLAASAERALIVFIKASTAEDRNRLKSSNDQPRYNGWRG